MNSRERALAALHHQEPDRVPVDYWATDRTDAKLCRDLCLTDRQAILDHFDVDFAYIDGPAYVGPPLTEYEDGTREDLWGVPRRRVTAGRGDQAQSYSHVTDPPLARASSVGEVFDYAGWPDPDWFDYSIVERQCLAAGDRCVMFMGDRLNRVAQFKPAQYLRGMEQLMIDMIESPDIFRAIVGRIADFYAEYMSRILAAARGRIDVFVTGDDFGMQGGMLIAPALWREFLRPGWRRFIDIAHSYEVPVMHHTCGSVRPIVPDMVADGLDILNPIQPGARDMDHSDLKREFGTRLAFHGGVSIQTNLPRGGPGDVRREVQRLMQFLKPGGGFWACTAHNIQADVPVENIIALFEAYRRFGLY
jgi:uroporphyrinogen decarboxylase